MAPPKPNDADTHVCGVCASALGIAFQGAERTIYCPKCRVLNPPMLSKKSNRLAIMRIQGRLSPERIDELERMREEDSMAQQLDEMGLTIAQTQRMEAYQHKSKLTRAEATEILMTCWPKAPVEAVKRATLLCVSYALNPLAKHVFLVKYDRYEGFGDKRHKVGEDWVTLMGIAATRVLARRTGRPYGYADGPRLMKAEEQVEIYGKVLTDYVCAITVLQDQYGLKTPGYGRIGIREKIQGAEKGNTLEAQAMIRSERAALDRLCPGEMPNMPGLDVVDERFIDPPQAGPQVTIVEAEPSPTPPGPRSWPNDGAFLQDIFTEFGLGKSEALTIWKTRGMPDKEDYHKAWGVLEQHRADAQLKAELDKAADAQQ